MSILANVTEIEDRVVYTVRSLQQPVIEYVRRGVERAEGRLPKLSYPENLPRPAEVVESQVSFAKALLDTQRDFVNDLVDAVSPLVRPDVESTAGATAAAADAESTSGAEAPRPAPKTRAKAASTKAKK